MTKNIAIQNNLALGLSFFATIVFRKDQGGLSIYRIKNLLSQNSILMCSLVEQYCLLLIISLNVPILRNEIIRLISF